MANWLGRLLDTYPIVHLFVRSCHWTLPPRNHYPRHAIGSECMSWFGAIFPLWQAPVPFFNDTKLLILSVNFWLQSTATATVAGKLPLRRLLSSWEGRGDSFCVKLELWWGQLGRQRRAGRVGIIILHNATYINNCDDMNRIIPITMFLVMLFNACFMYHAPV
jgi:hypothetical protein